MLTRSWRRAGSALVILCLLLLGCSSGLEEQPKIFRPLEESSFFGSSARPLVPNTVARGQARDDEHLYQGTVNGELAESYPLPITRELLVRGQTRYEIFCSPCHGLKGEGDGLIVQEGFPAPPSFHTEHLREAPAGHFYRVITEGQGAMYSYASRVPPEDRWAIAAYIRALQLSQNAPLEAVPPEERPALEESEE